MKLLKNIASLFSNNWGLKLLALLLAVIVYCSAKHVPGDNPNNSSHDRSFFRFR